MASVLLVLLAMLEHDDEGLATVPIDTLASVRGCGDETTGKCGIGPFSFGQTKECKVHDDCVERWAKRVGRPAADVVCAPQLPRAAVSAVKCAVDPHCPK